MAYDYDFKIKLSTGREINATYQQLIRTLGIDKEIIQGRPMTDGGTPQALFLKQLLMSVGDARPEFRDCEVEVYFNGNLIL